MKLDSERVAGVLADCERHCETDEETALVRWVAEKMADSITHGMQPWRMAREHAHFLAAALPITAAEQKRTILETLGLPTE